MRFYIEDINEEDLDVRFMGVSCLWETEALAIELPFENFFDAKRRADEVKTSSCWPVVREVPPCALSDSGAREVSLTGGLREPSDGRGAYELLPPGPVDRLAIHYERGARKYTQRNWEKGIETGRIMQSLLRHAFKYLAGSREEDHLAAVAWNAFALMHHEDALRAGTLPKELDTLPCLVGDK